MKVVLPLQKWKIGDDEYVNAREVDLWVQSVIARLVTAGFSVERAASLLGARPKEHV